MVFIIGFSLIAQINVLSLWQFWGGIGLTLLLLGVSLFGFKLAHDQSPLAAHWHITIVSAVIVALAVDSPQNGIAWLLFPISAVTSVIFFRPPVARVHALILTGIFLACYVVVPGDKNWPAHLTRAAFILILSYLVDRSRRRESQLMEEIANWSAEADAFTNISWSLTTLKPSVAEITAVLQRACPPEVSLALMRWSPDDGLLVTEAAVGEEAPAMQHWSYRIRPESTSVVAKALHERRNLMASITGENASLLLVGALPEVSQPLRSLAVLPIMRQGATPFGVLLAISSHADALGQAHRLGILPAVANQFALTMENARLFSEAQDRADHDAMTGLYHHRAIHTRLGEEVVRANRSATPFAVLMLDLDRFKLYNETYGHQVGDRILIQAANSLRRSLRSSDILGRYGGDEFLAILPDSDPAEALQVAQTLVATIAEEHFRPQEGTERMPLTLSVGIATYPNDGGTALTLVACSENTMNEAKHNGGNRCEMAERTDAETSNGRAVDLRGFGILESLVTAVDHKDRYTKYHSEEVATYAQLLAEEIGLPPHRCALLFDAGLLHDVGKVGVPDTVLRKPGRLTDEEMDAMKHHVVLSEALVRCLLPADTDPDVIDAVRYHHERWDGHGYPYGLAGEDVPLMGRIMVVVDATSAMHMDRPYRKGLSPTLIVRELRRGAGTQFDPTLVEPFVKVFLTFYHLSEADVAESAQSNATAA